MTGAVGYTRDASWWNHPDTHSPKRLHRPSDRDPGMAACNSTKIMLVLEAPVLIANHPRSLCRRCFPGGDHA